MSDSVFLIDSNVWIAQAFSSHPAHQVARSVLAQATATQPAVFCRATQQSFLRVASTPAVQQFYGVNGLTNELALAMLEQIMASPTVVFCDEPIGTVALWHQLARRNSASPKLWMDAYLAAFAIAASFTMVTLNADFLQFKSAGLNLQLVSVP